MEVNTFDLINFAVTIGLGVISIFLGGFAIWLSFKYNQNSNSALDKVKELAQEIKNKTTVGLNHQRDFSNKMLDSILSTSKYGGDIKSKGKIEENFESILKEELNRIEDNLTKDIEQKLKQANTGLEQGKIDELVDAIQKKLDSYTDEVKNVSSQLDLPIELKKAIKHIKEYPANLTVLSAIINEDITSVKDIENYKSKYNIPGDYRSGVTNLLEINILNGTHDNFKLNKDFRTPLTKWFYKNLSTIDKLIAFYKDREEAGVTAKERKIAELLTLD